MKIHYIVTSLETGGAEFAIPQVVKTIEQFGHSVDVTACEPRDMGAAPHLEKAGIPYRILFQKRPSFLQTVLTFINILRQSRPDVIWTSLSRATIVGQLAGKILGIPVVSWKNSANLRFSTSVGKKITKLWVPDSFYVGKFLHERMHIRESDIIPWPLYICQAKETVASYWDGQTTLQIGSTGRLHEVKNYPRLLKGLALFCERNPDKADRVHLSIAGDGPQQQELEQLIKDYHLEQRVSLLGFVSDVPHFLRHLHLYTQPSRYEGMCLAAHEAMGMGLPLMATPVGEMTYSVQNDKTGFVLQRDDGIPESVCKTLEYIFQNPLSLQHLGKNAREHVADIFSLENYQKRCKTILDRIEKFM
ncbi:glycosyltransferase [Saccharibacter sp. 17.LH.SD]|uniref:glycosyltransferase n=1 Tax=Saccharibacter sp. 17.LH.SD TaxID=2689393 RepID=UPI0013688D2A|nr:glycosyltransferase [Saccharibacter sp. 17.LH.SD]MXV43529.1 glycosyltransferase [Saccharibacter sp. 17.LH.SD]